MAIDPALVGFEVSKTLQDTLLNYVMSNRRLQENARQFNRQIAQRDKEFERVQGRFDRTEARQLAESKRQKDITQGIAQQQLKMAQEEGEIAKIQNRLDDSWLRQVMPWLAYSEPKTGEAFRATDTREAAKRMRKSLGFEPPMIDPSLIGKLKTPQELSLMSSLMPYTQGTGQFALQYVLNQAMNQPYGGQ